MLKEVLKEKSKEGQKETVKEKSKKSYENEYEEDYHKGSEDMDPVPYDNERWPKILSTAEVDATFQD